MKPASLFAAAALALAVVGPGAAADPAPAASEPATTVEGVTVTAPNKATISEFIRDVTEESRGGRVARWNHTICPATVGLQRRCSTLGWQRRAKRSATNRSSRPIF